ncbi:MAG: ComEC/Rec2 family competence protein [Clostridia bacterium]|nr:ComEC/Rec2 family competence protein [Clostridia bacterium]
MKKIINFRLAVMLAISVCLGVALVKFIYLKETISAVISIILAVLLCFSSFIFNKKANKKVNALISAFLALFFLLGGVINYAKINAYECADLNSGYYKVTARVDSVYSYDYTSRIILSKAYIKGRTEGGLSYKINLSVNGKLSGVEVGSVISFSANLKDKSVVEQGEFNNYDVSNKIKYYATADASAILIVGYKPTIFQRANAFIRDTLREGLSAQSFSVAYAMLTGNDEYIDGSLLENYRSAGVAHVFAVSGLHIGFLATALAFVFARLKLNKKLSLILTAVILIFYSGICSFTASSLRAVVMCITLLLTKIYGEKYDGLSSIGIACIIVLFINPLELFSVGFILSFAVAAGLFLLTNPISRLLIKLPKKFANALSAVISAQLIGVPICLYYFGEASMIAILANLIFIPLASAIFTLLIVCVMIGGIFSIEPVALFVCDYVFIALNFLISVLDYKIFMIGNIAINASVILYYLALLVASGRINLKRIYKVIVVCVLLVGFCLSTTVATVQRNNGSRVYVVGSNTTCASIIYSKNQKVLIVNRAGSIYSVSTLSFVASEAGISEFDYVILTDADGKTDLQVLVSKLSKSFSVKTLVYYGETRVGEQNALRLFFKNVNVVNAKDETLSLGDLTARYINDGRAIEVVMAENKMVFVSNMGESPFVPEITGKADLLVAVDYAEKLHDLHVSSRTVSYLKSNRLEDGQTNRRFCIEIT